MEGLGSENAGWNEEEIKCVFVEWKSNNFNIYFEILKHFGFNQSLLLEHSSKPKILKHELYLTFNFFYIHK